MKTADELIEQNQLATLVTERFEVVDADNENLLARYGLEAELMELIVELYSKDDTDFQYQKLHKFSLNQVLAYLQASHKYYLSKKLPELEQTMMHIFAKYSDTHQLLVMLTAFFNEYKNRLVAHIRMEEKEFFPHIKQLIEGEKGNLTKSEIENLLQSKSMQSFDENHDPIEDDLKEVSSLIHKFSNETDVPLPYRIFLNQVEIFELEMRKHAIIEDHVLVPMAKEIESKLKIA